MKAIIRGTGRFPVDMLRYDSCYPASETEAYKIQDTFDLRGRGSWEIAVAKVPRKGYPNHFTNERWASFGCAVTDVEYDS